jgi:hypothetical protein
MDDKIYYIVFVEGKMFQDFCDLLSGNECINKDGPYATEQEAADKSFRFIRASIVYNAAKRSFKNDPRHMNFPYYAVHNLNEWAKKNIPLALAPAALVPATLALVPVPATLALVPVPAATLAPALAPVPAATLALAPINEDVFEPLPVAAIQQARWSFYEQNSILHDQEDAYLTVEIDKIADKVFTAIKAYGDDFLSIAQLAKDMTFTMGIGMCARRVGHSKGVSEMIKEIEDTDTDGSSSFLLIKLEKKKSNKKISVPGFCGRTKKALAFTVEYSCIKPKNAAAQALCDGLVNIKILHKINFLKEHAAN